MNLSNVVRDLRINRMKQNQIQFGGSVGITQTYLSQIESGSKTPSSIILNRISEHIGIPLPILMYMSIEEKDIDKSKIESFRILNPKILELIKEFL
jgi:transcriptional regulator with XRE-family HTH domain